MAARTKISFATCNLFTLNLPGHSIYKDSDGWSQNEYDAKIDWLSRMLKTVDAGYWGFQELWHQDDHKITGTSDHAIVKATFEYRPNR